MFGRATITLAIGPHSSLFLVSLLLFLFRSMWQIKLTARQFLGARKYGLLYRIVPILIF